MNKPSLEKFLEISAQEVSALVHSAGVKVCVFPLNGTRRWFLLEHGQKLDKDDVTKNYIELTTQGYINTFKLIFDHGMDTILAPVFGAEIFTRGEQYMREIGVGMSLLATHPAFIEFYRDYGVRVHFYGDYHRQLGKTPYAYICESFDEIARHTAHHTRHKLFYGVCADNATASIAELSVKRYQDTGRIPSRRELIEAYYGEYIEKADIFIGFEKFTAFDYPMLGLGDESLYFTAAPSLYLNKAQWRNILYDHIYLRTMKEPDYHAMSTESLDYMMRFYKTNRDKTFGIGEVIDGIWYPKSDTHE